MTRRLLVLLFVAVVGGWIGAAPARAVSGGRTVPASTSDFVARLTVAGVRGCSGALVAQQRVITAAGCLAANGQIGIGAPGTSTTVTVGGTDLPVVRIHPHLALAKLSLRVAHVVPVAIGGTARAAGVGIGADEGTEPTTLVQLRVPA
jgi:hypothetical protein